MRTRLVAVFLLFSSVGAYAADDELPSPLPDDWTCLVSIKGNAFDYPDVPEDGLLLMGAFVATSSACQEGDVYVSVYMERECFERPKRNPQAEDLMEFEYKPRVLKIHVKPGNQAAEVLELKTARAGGCQFNTHIASCGTVVPPGAKCEILHLGDPRSEQNTGIRREFNRTRVE